MLSISNLTHRFTVVDILVNIDLKMSSNETVALVGPSGCGKSTLLHCVAGLLTPSEGRIESSFQRLGVVFQQPRLMPWKRASDNIALGLKAMGMSRDQRRHMASELAQKLGLHADDMDKYPHELSGGMQSRVALGRALAVSPDLLLLDEPFSALDVGLKSELYVLVRQHLTHNRAGALLITHDLMEAVRLADRVIMMAADPGRIVREFVLDTPYVQRDDAWVYAMAGQLMQTAKVKAC